jgi:two-component system, response regulator PdtaR
MGEHRARVLVVEDEVFVALDTAESLERAGHEVCGIAADRAGALRLAEEHRPDAALVDLSLADGRTGLGITRELWRRHGTVCVLTTAYPPELWPKHQHGAWGRIGKPYAPEALAGVIEYCLGLAAGRPPSGAPPPGLEVLA